MHGRLLLYQLYNLCYTNCIIYVNDVISPVGTCPDSAFNAFD